MYALWLKIIFISSVIPVLVLLIKIISIMVALYNNPNSVEFLRYYLLPPVSESVDQIVRLK